MKERGKKNSPGSARFSAVYSPIKPPQLCQLAAITHSLPPHPIPSQPHYRTRPHLACPAKENGPNYTPRTPARSPRAQGGLKAKPACPALFGSQLAFSAYWLSGGPTAEVVIRPQWVVYQRGASLRAATHTPPLPCSPTTPQVYHSCSHGCWDEITEMRGNKSAIAR